MKVGQRKLPRQLIPREPPSMVSRLELMLRVRLVGRRMNISSSSVQMRLGCLLPQMRINMIIISSSKALSKHE